MQIDNWLTAASYQEAASCRYTTCWYAQWLPMVQNHGRGKSISSIGKENTAGNVWTSEGK